LWLSSTANNLAERRSFLSSRCYLLPLWPGCGSAKSVLFAGLQSFNFVHVDDLLFLWLRNLGSYHGVEWNLSLTRGREGPSPIWWATEMCGKWIGFWVLAQRRGSCERRECATSDNRTSQRFLHARLPAASPAILTKVKVKSLITRYVLRTDVQRFLEQIAVWKCDIGEEAEVSGDLWVASGARQQTKDSIPCPHVSGWELSQPCRILVNKAICYASIIKIYVVHVKARCWNNVKTILALIDWRKSREKRRVNILELVMWPWSLGRLDAQNAHNLCRFAQPA